MAGGDAQEAEIQATNIPPSDDRESAIVATLNPGAYTAILAGKNSATGVGLVEIYDLDQSAQSKLANISTRGFVNTGDNVMIGGLIIGGTSGNGAKIRSPRNRAFLDCLRRGGRTARPFSRDSRQQRDDPRKQRQLARLAIERH